VQLLLWFLQSWRRLNPGWEIRFYDDEACIEFVSREFPEYLEAYRALPKHVERSDFFRYMVSCPISYCVLQLPPDARLAELLLTAPLFGCLALYCAVPESVQMSTCMLASIPGGAEVGRGLCGSGHRVS
jgi:hypothetical protein